MDDPQLFKGPSSSINTNETTYLVRTNEDTKYFYIAIASLVVFFMISIITTVLLCVTLQNDPILWEIDEEKALEQNDGRLENAQEISELNEENNV